MLNHDVVVEYFHVLGYQAPLDQRQQPFLVLADFSHNHQSQIFLLASFCLLSAEGPANLSYWDGEPSEEESQHSASTSHLLVRPGSEPNWGESFCRRNCAMFVNVGWHNLWTESLHSGESDQSGKVTPMLSFRLWPYHSRSFERSATYTSQPQFELANEDRILGSGSNLKSR